MKLTLETVINYLVCHFIFDSRFNCFKLFVAFCSDAMFCIIQTNMMTVSIVCKL